MSIGEFAREVSKKNLTDIKEYFEKNPYSTQADCARVLGLNPVTVNRHVKTLRQEMKKGG